MWFERRNVAMNRGRQQFVLCSISERANCMDPDEERTLVIQLSSKSEALINSDTAEVFQV